jgi:sugar (pentulose or hexulose) kinase
MQTEPATEFVEQAFSLLAAINWEKVDGEIVANLLPGNLYKVAFLSSVFNARIGLDELRRQGCPANELILTGGVLKTDISTRFAAQLIASALNIPVRVLPGGEEGTAFGGGLLGLYAHRRQTEPQLGYEQFLDEMLGAEKGDVFQPDAADVAAYNGMYRQHLELLRRAEPALIASLGKA